MFPRMLLVSVGTATLIAAASASAEQKLIRVSRETTHITRPLDADGYVDYVAAANERASRGVTAENNFEVVVRRIAGPGAIFAEYREEYFRRLGIPVPPEEGDYFVEYGDFLEARKLPAARLHQLREAGDRLSESPWKASDHPLAADWLMSINKHLDAIVEGSKRSGYYTPYVSGLLNDDEPALSLMATLLPSAHEQRPLGRALAMRAMLRVDQGQLDDAWSDLQALHRMARHVASGMTMIELFVGVSLETLAFEVETQMLNSSKLENAQARDFLADLKRLPALPPLAEKVDTFERHAILQPVQAVARQGIGSLLEMLKLFNDLSDASDPSRSPDGLLYVAMHQEEEDEGAGGAAPARTPDWNETMKVINGWFDRLTAAARIEDPVKRRRELQSVEADVRELKARIGDLKTALPRRLQKGSTLGELMIVLTMPAVVQGQIAADTADARLHLLRLAFAVEVYQREHGRFPAQLAELAPKHLDEVPRDPFSGEQFHYEPGAEGFVLYSAGRNGQNDGGRGYADRGERDVEWDDIVVKVGPR